MITQIGDPPPLALVDLRPAAVDNAGIGRYARNLVTELVRLAPFDISVLGIGGSAAVAGVRRLMLAPKGTAVGWRRDWWEMQNVERIRRDLAASVFHGTSFFGTIRPAADKTVVTVHDLTHFLFPQWHHQLAGVRVRLRMRQSIRRAAAIIAVSQATASDLARLFPDTRDRIRVIHNGVESRFNPTVEAAARGRLKSLGLRFPFVLSVGTVEPRKNHLGVLRALEKLGRSDLQWVIAGRVGWLSAPFERALELSPIRHQVLRLGFVADADLPELYRMADVVAYPSLYEGYGLPVLEALASGAVVVTSSTSSLGEVAGRDALLVDPTSVDEIAEAINLALNGRHGLDLGAGAGRAAAHTWDSAAQATLDVYRELAGRS